MGGNPAWNDFELLERHEAVSKDFQAFYDHDPYRRRRKSHSLLRLRARRRKTWRRTVTLGGNPAWNDFEL